jgi:hypothetical protein
VFYFIRLVSVVLTISPAMIVLSADAVSYLLVSFYITFFLKNIMWFSKQISVTPLDVQLRMHPEVQVSSSDWLTSILKGDEEA